MRRFFQGVLSGLLGNNAKVETSQIFRLGKKQGPQEQDSTMEQKPRLMMLKLKDKENVNELIKRRTQLKEVGFPNVYLTRDLSPEERAIEKKLRDELKLKGKVTHKIFRGKIVPAS